MKCQVERYMIIYFLLLLSCPLYVFCYFTEGSSDEVDSLFMSSSEDESEDEYEPQQHLKEKVDSLIVALDHNSLNVFLTEDNTFANILLQDKSKLLSPFECYIAIQREEDREGEILWHIYYLMGTQAKRNTRLATSEVAMLLFTTLQQKQSAYLYRRVETFKKQITLGEVKRYFRHSENSDVNFLNLYLVYERKSCVSGVQVDITEKSLNTENTDSDDPYDRQHRGKYDMPPPNDHGYSPKPEIQRNRTLRRKKFLSITPPNITDHHTYSYCVLLRVTQPELRVHIACGKDAGNNTRLAAAKVLDDLSLGLDGSKISYDSLEDAFKAFFTEYGSVTFHYKIRAYLERREKGETPLFKISGREEKIGPLKSSTLSLLRSKFCYLLDTRSDGGIYLWLGQHADFDKRIEAVRYLENYFLKKKTYNLTPAIIVEQGKEKADFKITFPDWYKHFTE